MQGMLLVGLLRAPSDFIPQICGEEKRHLTILLVSYRITLNFPLRFSVPARLTDKGIWTRYQKDSNNPHIAVSTNFTLRFCGRNSAFQPCALVAEYAWRGASSPHNVKRLMVGQAYKYSTLASFPPFMIIASTISSWSRSKVTGGHSSAIPIRMRIQRHLLM